jgi:hypothetical protein
VLPYQSPQYARPGVRGFPWGLLSLTLGFGAAVGVPLFDAVTKVPGFVQGPILMTGIVTAMLAVGAGIHATLKPVERIRGIIGISLGVVAFVLLPALARL